MNVRVLNSLESIDDWLANGCGPPGAVVRSQDNSFWDWNHGNKTLTNGADNFFDVSLYKASYENRSWVQPLVNEKRPGLLALFVSKVEKVEYCLVQSKWEPGNIDSRRVLTTTIQATYENIRVNGVENVPFYDFALDQSPIVEVLIPEDGGRFFRKANRGTVFSYTTNFSHPENFAWVELGSLIKASAKRSYMSCQFRALLATFLCHKLNLEMPRELC